MTSADQHADALVCNGAYDTPHETTQVTFFELIPRVRWNMLEKGSHMCHLEPDLHERVLTIVGEFLSQEEMRQL